MAKTIVVDVDEAGTVNIDAVGFSGKACSKAMAVLETALGRTVEVKLKPEHSAIGVPVKKTVSQGR